LDFLRVVKNEMAGECGKELLLSAREQGFTDLKLATNPSGAFLAGQDLQDCAGFFARA